LISVNQKYLKIPKNINLKQKKYKKILNFFKSAFETLKQTVFYET
jgi:preprotein translocase subunit SecE